MNTKKLKEKKKYKKSIKECKDYNNKLELDNMLVIRPSSKTIELLNKIAKHGIYGTTAEIVAERFIDDVIQRFVDLEEIKIKL